MASLLTKLRRDPRLVRLPPYLSALCVIVGIAWLLLLPLDNYSRRTYISENALLPGQVHTYFGGSEQNVFRAYRHEVAELRNSSYTDAATRITEIFGDIGLKSAKQKYKYLSSEVVHEGENAYSILYAPRGDATEAIVLVAALKNMDGELNEGGVALLLTLARYFKRWSLWSKDIIFIVTTDSMAGPQAWVDAYHDTHSGAEVGSLALKSGALQGVIVIDYPKAQRFDSIHIVYDGINGQLPNLDLVNTAVNIAQGQMGIGARLQQMWKHEDSYKERIHTMLRGMVNQGLGHPTGPHSSFIPYHVDAITIQTVGEGWHDEMALGRTVESLFRSLNNLLEHLHQSFFFYLIMHPTRFVSIGTYLPSAMLLAANFVIAAISLWVQSGKIASTGKPRKTDDSARSGPEERALALPLISVSLLHFLGVAPLYLFNHSPSTMIEQNYLLFTIASSALPLVISPILASFQPSLQHFILIKCFTLIFLGMFVSALATLNFSLASLVGLCCAPLSFIRPLPLSGSSRKIVAVIFNTSGPVAIPYLAQIFWKSSVKEILLGAAFGWDVSAMWTPVVFWCVWWPAWLTGSVLLATWPQQPPALASTDSKEEPKKKR